jgi:hypothetical protein
LERGLFDDEQQITLLHQSAVLKVNALQVAADAGPEFNARCRLRIAREIDVVDNLARPWLLHRDLGWRRRHELGWFFATV